MVSSQRANWDSFPSRFDIQHSTNTSPAHRPAGELGYWSSGQVFARSLVYPPAGSIPRQAHSVQPIFSLLRSLVTARSCGGVAACKPAPEILQIHAASQLTVADGPDATRKSEYEAPIVNHRQRPRDQRRIIMKAIAPNHPPLLALRSAPCLQTPALGHCP